MLSPAAPRPHGKVLSPSRLAHIVLRTPNFKAMVGFYKAILGAHAVYENDFLSFLTYDEEHHRIAIAHVPGTSEKIRSSAGLEHIAFTFDTLGDLTLAYKQRKARGIVPIWCVNHGPTTSMYYQDPDGNQLEMQVDNFDTNEEATAFMSSSEYGENPIGVDFDPEDLVRRVERGEDERELKKRPNEGPRGLDSVPEPPKPIVRESYELVTTTLT
ncbi:hypothetical protein NM208_g564 [Fusarium decemcellulare]|uniref:Uncharacterized protein n=2 Tax=Fusarium decemcellulare TaxID=57161 RepID=A0ACC1SZ87_9HYPO|nr:hypothetical protein NM208_g749 [Fusarium decemcellulare]KAJ3549311.1 hypothetical protein NM208_g564 [Fusarium decemcellulare]